MRGTKSVNSTCERTSSDNCFSARSACDEWSPSAAVASLAPGLLGTQSAVATLGGGLLQLGDTLLKLREHKRQLRADKRVKVFLRAKILANRREQIQILRALSRLNLVWTIVKKLLMRLVSILV